MRRHILRGDAWRLMHERIKPEDDKQITPVHHPYG